MKKILAAGATALVACAALAASSWAEVKDGRTIEVFHGIEYVDLNGYPAGANVNIEVLRGAKEVTVGSVNVQTDESGFVEVNHVGGGPFSAGGDCWDEPATPDIQPGDVVRATVVGSDPADTDTSVVRDVFVDQAATEVVRGPQGNQIVLKGHVRSLPNAPIDINADVLELRLNAGGFTWESNRNRRDLRDQVAVSSINQVDGTFVHAIPLVGGDADKADPDRNGTPDGVAEQAIEWSAAAVGEEEAMPPEITVFDGAEGALAGCPPLAETAMTSFSHSVINKATIDNGEPMTVGGPAQAGVTGVDVRVGGKAYPQVLPENGTWSLAVPAADLAALPQGAVLIEATFAGDTAPTGTQTKTIQKDTVAPTLTANPRSGTTAIGSVAVTLASDGGEQIRYTLDGNLPGNNNSQAYNGAPIRFSLGTHTIRAFSADDAGNRVDATFRYTVRTPPPPPNAAPVARANVYTVKEDRILRGASVLRNDTDADRDRLTARLVSRTTKGTLFLRPNGTFVYNSRPNFFGTDSFTYRAFDGKAYSKVVRVTIKVRPMPR